jgi:hypothetical protein
MSLWLGKIYGKKRLRLKISFKIVERRKIMYEVKIYKGDYWERQRLANEDRCVGYLEHHFNSSSSPSANYSVVITGFNASHTSKNWGRWYAQAVAREFDVPVGGDIGIKVGGYNGRGDYNLRFTDMPAILVEPLFASNPQHAEWIRSEDGQNRLAHIICESVQRFFQNGGIIGFSVGHKYKTSRPHDRGAPVYGGGLEADYAEIVLEKAKGMLEKVDEAQEQREIRVIKGDERLWKGEVDPDTDMTWDPARGILRIADI